MSPVVLGFTYAGFFPASWGSASLTSPGSAPAARMSKLVEGVVVGEDAVAFVIGVHADSDREAEAFRSLLADAQAHAAAPAGGASTEDPRRP
ncbi:predicted protein [Streptomyces filamentosus NRRL 15998]|uniref:Predicted protein n=1 Tax=Streptomyces filamentosus NRRL 15998 TaxID=457431 RepID=D6AMN9_STRFL|nr:predicted protein [Streptomyces filamentosus NRRL 15998]